VKSSLPSGAPILFLFFRPVGYNFKFTLGSRRLDKSVANYMRELRVPRLRQVSGVFPKATERC